MSRDKKATQQRLIDAVGKIIAEQGFSSIGVNAVAREAGVDKVLIYRYFGNLEGLLHACITQKDYFSNADPGQREARSMNTEAETLLEHGKRLLIGQLREVLQSKELQEILLWELNQQNTITNAIAEAREQQSIMMMDALNAAFDVETVDLPAITSIIAGGIYYLALRSRQIDTTFNGIDLETEDGWQRIEHAITTILDRVTQTVRD